MGAAFQFVGWLSAAVSVLALFSQMPFGPNSSAAAPLVCFFLSLILERLGRISDLLTPAPLVELLEDDQ